jgi:hypothetical protein
MLLATPWFHLFILFIVGEYDAVVLRVIPAACIGTRTNVGQTNVGQDKPGTGQTWDRQT